MQVSKSRISNRILTPQIIYLWIKYVVPRSRFPFFSVLAPPPLYPSLSTLMFLKLRIRYLDEMTEVHYKNITLIGHRSPIFFQQYIYFLASLQAYQHSPIVLQPYTLVPCFTYFYFVSRVILVQKKHKKRSLAYFNKSAKNMLHINRHVSSTFPRYVLSIAQVQFGNY